MPVTRCSYRNCSNSRFKMKGLKMFRIPPDNCEAWVQKSGNPDLIGLSPMTLKNKLLCEQHFRLSDILPSGRLLHGAVPMQYSAQDEEPTHSNSEEPSPPPRVQRTAGSPRRYPGKSDQHLPSPTVSTSSATFSIEKVSPYVRGWIQSVSPVRKRLFETKRALFQSPTKNKLLSTIKCQKKNLASKRAKISRLKRQVLTFSSIGGLKFKTKEAATLFKMQSHKKQTPWNAEEKKFAASLYLRSPATYGYLRKLLILPGESTIKLWLSTKKCFRTGFNKTLMEKIKTKAASMNPMEKACVVLFDEMAIKQCLEYSPQYDLIEGFEDIGNLGRHKGIAKEATVFMVRGLFYQWKLPVGYFVSDKGLLGSQTKLMIEDCINNLTDAGLSVKATVCDQSSTNVKAYKALGVTVNTPFFHTNRGQKIVALYDPPHLLKSLRNNLITHDFVYDERTISFSDVRQLFAIDSKSESTRAAPQLTPSHIWPNSFQKLSVPLAAQVFSHTTAAALKTVVETGQLKSSTALDTCSFLSQINALFDVMNSRIYHSKNPDACALSSSNSHVQEILNKALDLFKNMKKLSPKVPRPPCFDGFLITIRAYNVLLSSEGCKYLLTSRLNQDPLENLFSSVRQRGGWNRNPSVRVLRGTMRILTIRQLLEPPKTTSYDPDCDVLLDLGDRWEEETARRNPDQKNPEVVVLSSESSLSSVADEEPQSDHPAMKYTSDDFTLVTLEECSMVYFAGYLAHRYHRKYKCIECLTKMCDKTSNLSSSKELLILNKTFSNVKVTDTSGLLAPSTNLLYVVEVAIKVYKKLFKKVAHKLNVVKRILNATDKVITCDAITCPRCNEHSKFVLEHLFKVLIHKQCKWISSEMKKTAEEKLKVLKHV